MTPAIEEASQRRSQQPARPKTVTSTDEIDSTITRPGSVRINVKGAFIVDPDTSSPASGNSQASAAGSPTHHETSDIRLPNHTAVVSHIAVDVSLTPSSLPRDLVADGPRQIGGSLIKLVYFSREAHSTEPGGRLNFQSFETDRVDDCVELMKHLRDKHLELNGPRPGELCVMATGGGAYKFYDKIRDALGVDVLREDEMECLIIGMPGKPRVPAASVLTCQASTSSSPRSPARSSPTPTPIPCTLSAPARPYTPTCSSTLARACPSSR